MIIELLTTGIVFLALLIILAVLLQEGKSDMGLGSASRQVLFGGSGGQSILEKITWFLGFLFMILAMGLTIAKTKDRHHSVVESFANSSFADESPLVNNSPTAVTEEQPTIISENTPALPAETPLQQSA